MVTMLEHVNVTVSDPEATAAMYGRLFGWHLRWQGGAMNGGRSVHVGTEGQYVALYRGQGALAALVPGDTVCGGLNHIAVVVEDLAAAEALVVAEGLEPHSHYDYEPGTRFYFNDRDGIEYEVVCYG